MLVCPTSCLFFPKYHQCFGLLFNSQCNFWFVTALSSPGAGGHYFGRQGVTSSYYSYSCCHCHRCHIGECLLVLPEVHLLWVLPGCPSGTRQKTWSQQNKPNLTSSKVTRGELWPEVSAWRSPRTQRRHAVQRLIARSTHTVLSVSVINLSRYSESSTEVFWWNASRDNTFSSTWHSLAFFIFSVFIWFTAFFVDTTLLSQLKTHVGFQSSVIVTIFFAWWERPWEWSEFFIFWNCKDKLDPLLALQSQDFALHTQKSIHFIHYSLHCQNRWSSDLLTF